MSRLLIILLLTAGCTQTRTSGELSTNTPTTQIIEHDKLDSQIDLDSVLRLEHNDFLATLNNGTLRLCCYNLIDVTKNLNLNEFQNEMEEYKEDGDVKVVSVYKLDDSFIKTYYNNHPDVESTDLVCGQIRTDKIRLENGIKIGMPKGELLERLFAQSDTFDQIDRLEIYESELGEFLTTYNFKDGKLVEINFDSNYDWITRVVKK